VIDVERVTAIDMHVHTERSRAGRWTIARGGGGTCAPRKRAR